LSVVSGFSRNRARPVCGADRHFDRSLAGDHDHGRLDTSGAQVGQEREAVLARHHDIGKDHVEALGTREVQRANALSHTTASWSGEAEGSGQGGQGVQVVVNQEEAGHVGARFEKSRRAPGSLWTLMEP